MARKFKAEPGMQMEGIVVRIGTAVGDAEGKVASTKPKRASGFNPTFSPEMYKKRSYEGVTGFEAKYPTAPSDGLALLVGLKFNDIFAALAP